jgi:predicted GH43/DUF377 family glycosyl hydrolase
MRTFFFKLFLLIVVLTLSNGSLRAQYEWEKYPANPINIHGLPGSWDESVVGPLVIFNPDSSRYEMWYTELSNYPSAGVGFAYSNDGITWNKYSGNPVITPSTGWDSLFIGPDCVMYENGMYKMWYTGWNSPTRYPHSVGYATSPDGINWDKYPGNPIFTPGSGWESGAVGYPSIIKVADGYWMFYTGEVSNGIALTGRAFSTDGIDWQRDLSNNPVLPAGDPGEWDQNNYIPRVLEIDSLYLWYTAENNPGVSGSAIGYATSADTGKTWHKYSGNPILSRGQTGQWDNGWIETGSIILKDNEFKLYYDGGGNATGWMGRIGLATSQNVLPVELTSFTAKSDGKEVIIVWTTATELNNLGFEIQRSADRKEFSTVGFVKGYGTTTGQHSYTYSDKNLENGKYYYRLKQVDFNGGNEYSDVIEVEWRAFNSYLLEQNYPNPFNPATKIGYGIQTRSNVKITILNAIGEEIAVVLNEEKESGYHTVEFNASNLPSGVYFYRLQAGSYVETKKMILLK